MSSEVKQGFDLRTHVRGKDGQIIAFQPYRIVCDNSGMHYIRDGVRYYTDGSLIDPPDSPAEVKEELIPQPEAKAPASEAKGESRGKKIS